MSVQDRPHVPQGVAGDGDDFSLGAAGYRQPRHRSSAKVVEGHADDAGFLAGLPP